MIDIVSATRLSKEDFWSGSALGLSLGRLMLEPRLNARPIYENARGLGEVYNEQPTPPSRIGAGPAKAGCGP